MTPFGGGLSNETGREGDIHLGLRFDPFPAPDGWGIMVSFNF